MSRRPKIPEVLQSAAQRAGVHLVECLYPSLCLLCEDAPSERTRWFCERCFEQLYENSRKRRTCERCGQNLSNRTCACAITWDFCFERLFTVFDFDDAARSIIHEIKYGGMHSLAFECGRLFGALVPQDIRRRAEVVVPVPLHWRRRMERGYNQASWLARGYAESLPGTVVLVENALRRVRHTGTQTKLSRENRRENVTGAFAVRHTCIEKIHGKRALLVDDVVTTGATTDACAYALLHGGASAVDVVALARD